MAKGPQYKVPYRRRREHKTDYHLRRKLAIATHPRFVVRISNRNIQVQIVNSTIQGDYILTSANSRVLFDKYGWKASGNNTPAAYLIGLVSGYRTLDLGIDTAYLDMGLRRATKGSRIFAVTKGANDAGLEVPVNMDVVPQPERLDGSFIAKYAENIENHYRYEKIFSSYLKRGLIPEQISDHFEQVKTKIEDEYT